MPKVSIICPAFNPNEKWLLEAVNSAINQTHKDFEFIAINDGSENKEFIESLKKLDNRIKIIHHDRNYNQATALSTGIGNVTGKYICFLDCDDIWDINKLKNQVSYLENNKDVDMIYADGYYIDKDSNVTGKYNLNDNAENLLQWNCICVGSVMIKKKVFDEIGLFDINLTRSQDWDMWLRVYKAGYKIKKMKDVRVIFYRLHNAQKSDSNLLSHELDHQYIKRKHRLGVIK